MIDLIAQRLQAKIVAGVALVLLVFLGASYSITTYLTLTTLNEEFEDATRRKAVLLMDAIYNNIAYTTESGHMRKLLQMAELTNSYTELQQLVIFSQDGIIRQSINAKDIGKKISEAHYDVYKDNAVRGRAYDAGSDRQFCMVRPLFNQERCHGCHDKSKRVLGVLDVCLNMNETRARMAKNRDILRTAGFTGAVATVVATSMALALLLTFLVTRPVSRMVRAIREVEGGNMESRVELATRDELGAMGRSFNSMIETIRKLNEMKDDFISIVSHELRTPLTSIKYFAEVMMERVGSVDPARQQKYLRVINEETDRLTRLINDLLDLQKISAGKFKWKVEEVNLEQVVRNTAQTFAGAAAARNVGLLTQVDPGLPIVLGDRDKVVQLVANLLSNAIKFTRVGSRVVISAERGNDPAWITDRRFRSYVRVAVTDEGIGIAPENLDKIFEKFQQVEDHFTRSQGGTGLGLSICKEIVLHHGGRIWAESEVNTGSTFFFTIPYEEKPEGGSAVPVAPAQVTTGAAAG
ncbi:MAG TPA: HAMP domain-containing sensor histidine kinase [Candidatus Methanoperedens sp.]|nr:HAMP domain-containing sensor histidine kinase [Candidatus Methanoperedens sp.]